MIYSWKLFVVAFCATVSLPSSLADVIDKHRFSPKPVICNQGQRYWCKNITTSVQCNAFNHCVHAVWEQEIPIEVDKSSVCQTCVDMVKLARDQLNSNETQEELRQVLEGSCKIIPVRTLKHDCDKLMDDFGSYIVDTLSSEMNPQVVCSVAGLCNNPKYAAVKGRTVLLDCDNCLGLVKTIEGNIQEASTKDLFTVLAGICGRFGSFSDSCSSLISENMANIDGMIRNTIKRKPVCTFAGVCNGNTDKIHRVSISDSSVNVKLLNDKKDDLPCELCEQLVNHLKDVLIANTTVEEFKEVLRGLCMMSIYKNDCDSIINQYYSVIYDYIVEELDGKVLCKDINICPNSGVEYVQPLILVNDETTPKQLPIERMNSLSFVPSSLTNQKHSPELCSFCEYFLHFVQQEITLPSSEKEITDIVLKGCAKLPSTVQEQCNSFVQTYMAAFIALLAQRIDPSQVCPSLGVCPSQLVAVEYKDKPTCPLCLLAMESTLKKVQNRTEADINDALDDLCLRDVFPNTITTECVKFITDFRKPVIDMILAEFTSQEACVYIDLCKIPHSFTMSMPLESPTVSDIETNEIHEVDTGHTCVICEFVMAKLDNALKDKKTEEEIKDTVYKICSYMPKTVAPQCHAFIEQYANLILTLLAQELEPKEICRELNLCGNVKALIAGPVKKCIACELLMDSLKTVLTDKDVDNDINKQLLKACESFPHQQIQFCQSIVNQLAPQIEMALRTLPVGPLVCRRIKMCESDIGHRVSLIGRNDRPQCYLGPGYWCSSTIAAARCEEIEYCQKNIWKGDKPRRSPKGTIVI